MSLGMRLMAVVPGLLVALEQGTRAHQAQVPAAEPSLRAEWTIPRSDAEVFAAARDTLRDLGFRFARRDDAAGLLVTRQARYSASWPGGEALELPSTHVPATVTLYVHVAPGFHPARLAVGAVLDTATTFVPLRGDRARGTSTIYGYPPLAAFFAARIAERLGVAIAPLAVDPGARARDAVRLDARAGPCGAAGLVEGAGPLPRLKHEVKPQYPAPELNTRIGGAVRLRGEVTEHGTLTGLDWVGGVEEPNLVAAATGAASLWRFTAPVVDGCPVRRMVTIEMSFTMRR